MKIMWKRLNRGIILAVLLAGGVTVFEVVQNIRFKNNKPVLAERVQQLGEEAAEANIGSGEPAKRKQRALVQNNYIEGGSTALDMMNESSNKGQVLYTLNMDHGEDGTVLSAKYEQISASVERSGQTGAVVSVDYKFIIECDGTPQIFDFSGANDIGWLFEDEDLDKHKTIEFSASADIRMEPDGGEWKIASVTVSQWDMTDVKYDEAAPENEGGEPVG